MGRRGRNGRKYRYSGLTSWPLQRDKITTITTITSHIPLAGEKKEAHLSPPTFNRVFRFRLFIPLQLCCGLSCMITLPFLTHLIQSCCTNFDKVLYVHTQCWKLNLTDICTWREYIQNWILILKWFWSFKDWSLIQNAICICWETLFSEHQETFQNMHHTEVHISVSSFLTCLHKSAYA